MTVEILAGGSAIFLGIPGLLGFSPEILLPAAIIAVGASSIFAASGLRRLNTSRFRRPVSPTSRRRWLRPRSRAPSPFRCWPAAAPSFLHLPASYEQRAIYVVQVQLEKAGVRLAAVLNQTASVASVARHGGRLEKTQ
jgi:hypothetical protein